MDQGTSTIDQLRDELTDADSSAFVRAAACHQEGRRILRHLQAIIGPPPPGWQSTCWEYEEATFVAGVLPAHELIAAFSTADDRTVSLGGIEITIPRVQEQAQWEREPSRGLSPPTLPWPTVRYSIKYGDAQSSLVSWQPQSQFLIGDDCPSFRSFSIAFSAFFYDDFANTRHLQPPIDAAVIRIAQLEAWLGKIRVTPTQLRVTVCGRSVSGCRVELNGGVVRADKRVGRSGRVQLPLRDGLPPETWLYLSRDGRWLDYRALGSRLTAAHDLTALGVEVLPPADPATEIEPLIAMGEGPTVEFKRQFPGKSREELRKVLKTVAAFANGEGGTIIFGIDPDETTIIGLNDANVAEQRDRLTNLVRDHVRPTPDIDPRSYTVDGKSLMALVVGRGSDRPCGVVFHDGPVEYYVRRGASTYPARHEEIRRLHLES